MIFLGKGKYPPSSIHVMPRDHMSTLPSYCPSSMANITSGAIQYGVPTKELAGEPIDADPKSAAMEKAWYTLITHAQLILEMKNYRALF